MRCIQRYKNGKQCQSDAEEGIEYCSKHDMVKNPYVVFLKNYRQYFPDYIKPYPKKKADSLVKKGIARYLDQPITKKKLLALFDKACDVSFHILRNHIIWLIRIQDDEGLIGGCGNPKDKKANIKLFKQMKLDYADLHYLSKLFEIPLDDLVEFKVIKNAKRRNEA